MIRTKGRIYLGAAALCTSALVIDNCSRNMTPDTGHVSLALTVPGGVSVGPVTYTINRAGSTAVWAAASM